MFRYRLFYRSISFLACLLAVPSSVYAKPSQAQGIPLQAAQPQQEQTCETCLDTHHQLRRLSLDLRHKLPSYDELLAYAPGEPVAESTIDSWLAGDDFKRVSERFHEALFWPNLSLTKLTIPPFRVLERGGSDILGVGGAAAAKRRRAWRDDPDITCLDQLQEEFETVTVRNEDGSVVYRKDENGNDTNPLTYTVPVPMVTDIDGEEVRQEGYVWVYPYWSPQIRVKVCAYTAMSNDITPQFGSSFEPRFDRDGAAQLASCAGEDALVNEACGCGEDLRYCFGPGIEKDIQHQLGQQLLRLVEAHTIGNRPYSEMLTTNTVYTNERLLYWWKYLSQVTSLNREFNHYSRGETPLIGRDGAEDLDYSDDTWFIAKRNVLVNDTEFKAGHSGLLTLPGYTLRFQTNRSRANRFRILFMGQYFIPADTIEDENNGDNCSNTAADLTQRCTCRACHIELEPLAAAWGVVAEGGGGMISDRERFPIYRESCAPAVFGEASDGDYDALALRKEFCPRFWVSDAGKENPGVLNAYQFVFDPNAYGQGAGGPKANMGEVHSRIWDNLEAGPATLAENTITAGIFHRTMVQHIFRYFMGREMILDAQHPSSELLLLNTLTEEFKRHDDFKRMVKGIVMLEQYRRAGR